jgi:hypothetical protein
VTIIPASAPNWDYWVYQGPGNIERTKINGCAQSVGIDEVPFEEYGIDVLLEVAKRVEGAMDELGLNG